MVPRKWSGKVAQVPVSQAFPAGHAGGFSFDATALATTSSNLFPIFSERTQGALGQSTLLMNLVGNGHDFCTFRVQTPAPMA
jgi:hypothetical protein